MNKPTGKLKFAYETIANMEAKINQLKNKDPDLTIDKCIEYLKENASKLNREQVVLFKSINVSWSCAIFPECQEPPGGFECNKCIPL